MSAFMIELKKEKRSGVIPVMLIVGVLGALYAFANFIVRKDTLLSLPLPPMVVLLTQLYGMLMVLNLFGLIVVTSMIFNIEFRGNAIRKIYMLPIETANLYMSKFIIIFVTLAVGIAVQNGALAWIGSHNLPKGTFEMNTLIQFAGYSFITSLPVLTFMLMIASRMENIWITLGIGVAGFLSGMSMATFSNILFLLNPFVLIMKPVFEATVELNFRIIIVSIIETIIFLLVGWLMTKYIRYE